MGPRGCPSLGPLCTFSALFSIASVTLILGRGIAESADAAPSFRVQLRQLRGTPAAGPGAQAAPPAKAAQLHAWRWQPQWDGGAAVERDAFRARVWQGLQAPYASLTAGDATQALLDAAAGHNRTLAVLQVGACDGDWEATNDPVQSLLRDERVHALVMEPVPTNFKELDKRMAALSGPSRRLMTVNAAMCMEASAAPVPFYVVSERFARDNPDAQHWAKRELGSFLRSHLRKHRIPNEYIETLYVPCMTAQQIFQVAASPVGADPAGVDALVIDAEGLDGDLLEAFLAVKEFQPAVVVIEQKHLKRPQLKSVQAHLQKLGYASWQDKDQLVAMLAGPNAPMPAGDSTPSLRGTAQS